MILYINNSPVDIGDEVVEIKEAPNALQSLSAKTGAYTNRFTVLRNAYNQRLFDFIGTPNNASKLPYTRLDARIEQGGTQIYSGFVKIIETTRDTIKMAFFGTNSNWINLIKGKSIRDLDLAQYNHVWEDIQIEASNDNTWKDGYIYSVYDSGILAKMGFNLDPELWIPIQLLPPSIFVKRIFQQIFREAGYELGGDWFESNERFSKQVIFFTNGIPIEVGIGQQRWDVAQNLPNISQTDFVREIANQYLLILYPDEQGKVMRPVPFEELRNGFATAVDWSDKIEQTESNSKEYRFFDVFQRGTLEYKQVQGLPKDSVTIDIEDDWLEPEGVIYQSLFANAGSVEVVRQGDKPTVANLKDILLVPNIRPKEGVVLKIDPTPETPLKTVGDYIVTRDKVFKVLSVTTSNPPGANFEEVEIDEWAEVGTEPVMGTLEDRRDVIFDSSFDRTYYRIAMRDTAPVRFISNYGVFTNNLTDAPVNPGFPPSIPPGVPPKGIRQDWKTLATEYYRLYTSTVNQLEFNKVLVRLTTLDFVNLDFTKPIYIDNPAMGLLGFYYINALTSYQPGQSALAEFELIKIHE